MSPFFADFVWVWLLWAAAAWLTLRLTFQGLFSFRPRKVARLLRGEDGAAYTLSYVLTLPLYLAIVCVFIESSMMLQAKIGTVHASFAAARAAIVWNSVAGPEETLRQSRAAAARTMTPFASGLGGLRLNLASTGESRKYRDAYQEYAAAAGAKPRALKYVEAKRLYAERAVDVRLSVDPLSPGDVWDQTIEARVSYRFPFSTPFVGKLLGSRDGDYYYREINTSATLQDETPRNESRELGIRYASP